MDSNHKAVSNAMSVSEFSDLLQQESKEFWTKFNGSKFDKNIFESEAHFLQELKKSAPNTYDKLSKANFKFKLDEETKKQFADLVKQSEDALQKLNEQKKSEK